MEESTDHILGSKSEKRHFNRILFRLVVPITFQSFMTAAVSTSDAIMVGFLDRVSLPAVSLAGQITFVLNLFVIVLVQGMTLMVAQYWGKGDKAAVEKIFGLTVKYMFFVSSMFFLMSFFFSRELMQLFTNESALVEKGAEYLQIAGFSYVPLAVSQIYLCIMKNTGRTFQNTLISSVCMALNIALNGILIFGLLGMPAMGVRGAALATTISMSVQFFWTVGSSLEKNSIRLKLRFLLRTDSILRKDFIKYTLPIAGNYFFWGIGTTLYSVIIGHMGSDAVAANSVVNIIKNLITCTSKGISTASGIVIGNELGSNQLENAKVHAKRMALFSGICGGISGIIILILRPFLSANIALSETALQYMSGMLLICSYCVVIGAIDSTVIGGIFCAGGKSKFGLIADAIVIWLIVVPSAAVSAFYFKMPVLFVYFILNLDECIKIPAVYCYFRKYSWVNNITR